MTAIYTNPGSAHMALLSGQLMFAIIVFVLTGSAHNYQLPLSDPLTIVAILLTGGMIPTGYYIFQQRMKQAVASDDPSEKMTIYHGAFILRCATNEGVSLFSIILVLLTHSFAYYVFLAISLVFFAMANPTLEKIKRQIGVTE
jgi:hypothetical protein